MSGGSMDYIYSRIQENCVGRMGDVELNKLMKDIADLLYEREWYTSGDTGEDDWEKAKNKFKNKWLRGGSEERLKKFVEQEAERLKEELISMIGVKK